MVRGAGNTMNKFHIGLIVFIATLIILLGVLAIFFQMPQESVTMRTITWNSSMGTQVCFEGTNLNGTITYNYCVEQSTRQCIYGNSTTLETQYVCTEMTGT